MQDRGTRGLKARMRRPRAPCAGILWRRDAARTGTSASLLTDSTSYDVTRNARCCTKLDNVMHLLKTACACTEAGATSSTRPIPRIPAVTRKLASPGTET